MSKNFTVEYNHSLLWDRRQIQFILYYFNIVSNSYCMWHYSFWKKLLQWAKPCDRIRRKIAFRLRRLLSKVVLQWTNVPFLIIQIDTWLAYPSVWISSLGYLTDSEIERIQNRNTHFFPLTLPLCIIPVCDTSIYTGAQARNLGIQHFLLFPFLISKPCRLCLLSAQQIDFPSHIFVVSRLIQPLLTLFHEPLLGLPVSLLASPVVQFLKQIRLCHCPQRFLVTSLCLALCLPDFHFSNPPLRLASHSILKQEYVILHFYGSSFCQWNCPLHPR